MEVVLFHIRTRADIDEKEYQSAFEHMLELVSEITGFEGIEAFTGEDGSELAVARFSSPESIAAWRDHPEHVRTRARGRTDFFEAYDITIATVWRHYDWSRSDAESAEGLAAAPD
jgi:heme-degrading monooxygenase HmoA